MQLWSTEITSIVYRVTLFEKMWGKSMLDSLWLLFDPKVLISYYLLFHMLFLMLCVLPTGFICHTVTAFHDKVSNCNARRKVCVWPISFFIAGDSALSSIVTYLWYLRNIICKTSVFGGIVQTRRKDCDREDSEIALTQEKEKEVYRKHATSMWECVTYIPRIASSTFRCSSAAP